MISVVIPVFNERDTISVLLEKVRAVPFDKEIIVVDDGSTDGTRDVLAKEAERGVRVILHEVNQGKGAALRTGFRHCLSLSLAGEPRIAFLEVTSN